MNLFGLILLCCLNSAPESENPNTVVHHIGISVGSDYVASSMEDEIRGKIPSDNKISTHTSLPLNLRYGFSFTNPYIRNYYPGGYQGIGIGVLNLGIFEKDGVSISKYNIGYPVKLFIYQGAPFWTINPHISLNYEWNFGATFGWKPYSELNRFYNLTVGSKVNAYLGLNFFLNWKLNPHIAFIAGIGVSHFSNGNTSFPNPGINTFGLNLGLNYTLNPLNSKFPEILPDSLPIKKIEYDISLWGARRKRVYKGGENPVLRPGHFTCAGISFAPMVCLNTWWRVGGSLDLQWDQSSDMERRYISGATPADITFSSPSFIRQVSVGLSAHGELKMPIFAVNLGIGYNVIAPSENRYTYQNITLKTYLCRQLFLNVGYQLRNFYQQSSLMLGLGLTL